MKMIASSSILIQFEPEQKDDVKQMVDDLRQRAMDEGYNVEVAWDVDHVRIVGKQEFLDEKK